MIFIFPVEYLKEATYMCSIETQQAFTCSKSIIERHGRGVKYVQS